MVLKNEFHFEEGETLLFNKPLRWTSFDVVKKVRRTLVRHTGRKRLKVGHAGTLDPLATGLLVVCTGKMTKRIDEFQAREKEYTGTMRLGVTTPSYDLETEPDRRFDTSGLTETALRETVRRFLGEQEQAAPAYSAVKIEGERSYQKARRGETPPPRPRHVSIYEFELTSLRLPEVDFRVVCSKGTYIRSLVHDFGRALNNGACLTVLTRTRIGDFRLAEAWEVAEFVERITGADRNNTDNKADESLL